MCILGPQAHKLAPDEAIAIDGRLDDAAWSAVPWTEAFQDIEGSLKGKPRFETKVNDHGLVV